MIKITANFKNDYRDVYTEEINKIGLSSNNNKRLQTSDKITTCPYGAKAFKVWESEMLMLKRLIFWKIIIKVNTCRSQRIKMINFDNYTN